MAKFRKQGRHKGKTRLSGRNTLETLNDLLQVLNPTLPEDERLHRVTTPKDLHDLRQRIKTLSPKKGSHASASCPEASAEKVQVVPQSVIRALTAIATNAWRARNKMVDPESGEAKDEMKPLYRHVDAVFDVLKQVGVEIMDLQGRAYDSGMPLKVVSFEPTPGLSKEKIKETIKPAIAWQGRLIQTGEVIVGTPQMLSVRKGDSI